VTKGSTTPGWQRALVALTATVIGVVLVGALYWAQVVFIPVALAIFLAFVLNPPVRALQRRGLGRIPAPISGSEAAKISRRPHQHPAWGTPWWRVPTAHLRFTRALEVQGAGQEPS
jgi:hypothetical protein